MNNQKILCVTVILSVLLNIILMVMLSNQTVNVDIEDKAYKVTGNTNGLYIQIKDNQIYYDAYHNIQIEKLK